VYTGTLTADLLLGDVHSLKGNVPWSGHRGRAAAPLRRRGGRGRRPGPAPAGAGRRRHGRGDAGQVTDVLDACERLLAERPEVTLLSTHRQLFSDTD
jgi:hypothetical protein